MCVLVRRKQRRVFVSHYRAVKQKKKRGRPVDWGKGIRLSLAERHAILYPERTHLLTTDISYNILRQKKYSHESD